VLALESKFAEAEEVSRKDMSADAAASNVAAIRAMIAQNESWKALQSGAAKKRPPGAEPAAATPTNDPPSG
jgi:hypothetical protein